MNSRDVLQREDRRLEQSHLRGHNYSSMCKRKGQYASAKAAYDVRRKMERDGIDISNLWAYICGDCRFWHLGHP